RAVDAVAQSAFFARTVGEHVPEVAFAARTDDFGANHAVRHVAVLLDRSVLSRAGEAGPAGSAVELGFAFEQRLTASGANIFAVRFVLFVLAGESPLGAAFAQHAILLRRQPLAPFGIGQVHLLGHVGSPLPRIWELLCSGGRERWPSSPLGRRPQSDASYVAAASAFKHSRPHSGSAAGCLPSFRSAGGGSSAGFSSPGTSHARLRGRSSRSRRDSPPPKSAPPPQSRRGSAARLPASGGCRPASRCNRGARAPAALPYATLSNPAAGAGTRVSSSSRAAAGK